MKDTDIKLIFQFLISCMIRSAAGNMKVVNFMYDEKMDKMSKIKRFNDDSQITLSLNGIRLSESVQECACGNPDKCSGVIIILLSLMMETFTMATLDTDITREDEVFGWHSSEVLRIVTGYVKVLMENPSHDIYSEEVFDAIINAADVDMYYEEHLSKFFVREAKRFIRLNEIVFDLYKVYQSLFSQLSRNSKSDSISDDLLSDYLQDLLKNTGVDGNKN